LALFILAFELEVCTWLRKIKLAFKVQCIYNQVDKLNVALQHFDGEVHTWGKRWIARNPKAEFGSLQMHYIREHTVTGMSPMMFN